MSAGELILLQSAGGVAGIGLGMLTLYVQHRRRMRKIGAGALKQIDSYAQKQEEWWGRD